MGFAAFIPQKDLWFEAQPLDEICRIKSLHVIDGKDCADLEN
jgi:hypothetical protein